MEEFFLVMLFQATNLLLCIHSQSFWMCVIIVFSSSSDSLPCSPEIESSQIIKPLCRGSWREASQNIIIHIVILPINNFKIDPILPVNYYYQYEHTPNPSHHQLIAPTVISFQHSAKLPTAQS